MSDMPQPAKLRNDRMLPGDYHQRIWKELQLRLVLSYPVKYMMHLGGVATTSIAMTASSPHRMAAMRILLLSNPMTGQKSFCSHERTMVFHCE